MKTQAYLILATSIGMLTSCDKILDKEEAKQEAEVESFDELTKADTPILPVKQGDYWKYQIRVEIPAGITSPGASAVETELEKVRTYIGKVSPGDDLPEVDAFDVTVPGEALEREFVEISEKLILMRGTGHPEVLDSKVMWLDPPVPFVFAGMRAGNKMADLSIHDGVQNRGLRVIAREEVETPIGKFTAIRLLMTGNDGKFELRRTTWFVPQVGIVKEEKTRYGEDKLIFRETTLLFETSVAID
ncbi:MAG: hypothetical protein ACSHX9_17195 [Luteolibacter sp.]